MRTRDRAALSNEDDPMNILTELQSDIWAVAKNLESREWIQGKMQEGDAVCAYGAVKTCNLRPGDEHADDPIIGDPDSAPKVPKTAGRTKKGQAWRIGKHRVLVGDATDTEQVLAWLGEDRAAACGLNGTSLDRTVAEINRLSPSPTTNSMSRCAPAATGHLTRTSSTTGQEWTRLIAPRPDNTPPMSLTGSPPHEQSRPSTSTAPTARTRHE